MKRSTDRILTTHAGSLPRPADLVAMAETMQAGDPDDTAAYEARLTQAVGTVVREQAERGIDIVSDGEFGKPGFLSAVSERLSGFEVDQERAGRNPWARSKEVLAFPDYYAEAAGAGSHPVRMVCTGPITYRGHAQLERHIANFRAALDAATVEEAFISAVSPATVEAWHRDAYYECEIKYLLAIAAALREEYRAIVDAGFLLQIEDPGLLTFWQLDPRFFTPHHIDWSRLHVAALNSALRGIAREKIRFHTCYGINMGPRVHDEELNEFFVEVILEVRAGAFSFEAANPRHEHEWQIWEKVKLPEGAILIPGVISNSTVVVEHPELVAQRICRFANIVGRENVIAGSDGGFANFASSKDFHPSIAWAKLQALAKGARLASEKLFPSPGTAATPPDWANREDKVAQSGPLLTLRRFPIRTWKPFLTSAILSDKSRETQRETHHVHRPQDFPFRHRWTAGNAGARASAGNEPDYGLCVPLRRPQGRRHPACRACR